MVGEEPLREGGLGAGGWGREGAIRAWPRTLLRPTCPALRPTWLARWLLPSCWMALSADQGSSMVRCARRRRFFTAAEACREMPVEAASDTMATSLEPCAGEGAR